MKINSLLVLGALLSTSSVVWSHTAAHLSRPAARAVVDEALGLEETAIPVQTHEERWWGVNVNTGWESRHVHYGVDESGPTGAYVNEAGLSLGDLSFNAWNGVGTGNTLVEWDFTVAYNIEAGPVFIVPGYNLRSVPSFATGGEDDGHGEHEKEDGTDDHAGHTHNTIGHELLVALGTTAIHYVTPSANFIWDLNNNPGGFLELRLDGHVPVYADIVSLQPYTNVL